MLLKNHPIILFIDRFGFSVYQDTLANIPKFNFTPDLVANLDVINKEQFVNLIVTFIQINKIIPSSLAVILSDSTIYVKDLANPVQRPVSAQGLKTDLSDDKERKDEVRNFLEDVPFEEVLAKVIKVGSVNRIVAANKDLVMAIIEAFVSKGSVIEAIIPGFIYGQSANFATGLNQDNVRIVLGNAEILKSGNLLTDQEKMISSQNLESELKNPPADAKQDLTGRIKKPRNRRQYILIGIFVILLIVLAVVYFTMGASPTQTVNSVKNSASRANIPTPTPVLVQAAATIVSVDIKSVKVKIVQSVQTDEKAAGLRSGLLSLGFADVVSEISEVSVPEKSSVIFSQSIPADFRNNLIVEIKKILPNISILESQESGFTISIVIGKS